MKAAFRICRIAICVAAFLCAALWLLSWTSIIPQLPDGIWGFPWSVLTLLLFLSFATLELIARADSEVPPKVFLNALSEAVSAIIGLGLPASRSSREREFERYLKTLQNQSKAAPLSIETEQRITEIFEEALGSGLNDELQIALDNLAAQKVSETLEIRSLSHLGSITENLQTASKTVTIRGFLNLAIGIIFAIAALVVLQSSVALFTPETIANQTAAQILYLVGIRVSLAIIITVIAYFFLSLYKNSLEDVKYYQNEMTNVGMIESAICMSYDVKSETVRQIIAAQISSRAVQSSSEDVINNSQVSQAQILDKLLEKIPSIKIGDTG
ncbi:hypothetical protein [Sphingorhabdus sp. SMR4y]|uniref:hypothetical protein n=1 Tax=Sphingorhabdus sp. SMR4y TaxID=2584094 RepID=UPI000B5F3D3C|nr:hypothetical protein [Sphingorhabdus sp. SMR4y]ASK90127.1 hypothetical protein SPHFLASMR4Y_03401 [Sphingorhabdus sp. SMR4y]